MKKIIFFVVIVLLMITTSYISIFVFKKMNITDISVVNGQISKEQKIEVVNNTRKLDDRSFFDIKADIIQQINSIKFKNSFSIVGNILSNLENIYKTSSISKDIRYNISDGVAPFHIFETMEIDSKHMKEKIDIFSVGVDEVIIDGLPYPTEILVENFDFPAVGKFPLKVIYSWNIPQNTVKNKDGVFMESLDFWTPLFADKLNNYLVSAKNEGILLIKMANDSANIVVEIVTSLRNAEVGENSGQKEREQIVTLLNLTLSDTNNIKKTAKIFESFDNLHNIGREITTGIWEWRRYGATHPYWISSEFKRGLVRTYVLTDWDYEIPLIDGEVSYWNNHLAQLNIVVHSSLFETTLDRLNSSMLFTEELKALKEEWNKNKETYSVNTPEGLEFKFERLSTFVRISVVDTLLINLGILWSL